MRCCFSTLLHKHIMVTSWDISDHIGGIEWRSSGVGVPSITTPTSIRSKSFTKMLHFSNRITLYKMLFLPLIVHSYHLLACLKCCHTLELHTLFVHENRTPPSSDAIMTPVNTLRQTHLTCLWIRRWWTHLIDAKTKLTYPLLHFKCLH